MDYNKTLNLPKTDFPMRGNLPKREPETLKKWEDDRLYYKMIENNKGKPKYILHDGTVRLMFPVGIRTVFLLS